jgi:hypothetical protein
MRGLRTFLVAGVGALSLLAAGTIGVPADEGGTVISFHSMTPVTGGARGTVNDRGLTGGGIAWRISSGTGSVARDGHVSATVSGLVLDAGTLKGTNPIGTFAAVVSCRTTAQTIANVRTGGVPADGAGNATINAAVDLPHPCSTPEVFVGGLITTSTGQVIFRWFSVSNGDFADRS